MHLNSNIEIFESPDGQTRVEVTFDHDTVWLNREQLSDLFDRDRTVISRHIRNIFTEGELEKNVVCADFAHTTRHGAIKGETQNKTAKFERSKALRRNIGGISLQKSTNDYCDRSCQKACNEIL
ncbi:MAG: hypothetical protein ABR572_11220 [Cryomorphaceae bacterium]